MDFGWLEDLIAIAESDSLTEAAERRNSSQPAFSRRIQSIEHWLGTAVLDRTLRPAKLVDSVFKTLPEVRSILAQLRDLRTGLNSSEDRNACVVIASLHSIACGLMPELLVNLKKQSATVRTRLIAGERDDCYALLMTRQAAIIIVYETSGLPIASGENLIEKKLLLEDSLVPVASPALIKKITKDRSLSVPLIRYPDHTFFGSVVLRDVYPAICDRFQFHTVSETVLVPAALEFAAAGLGVAWVPYSLARQHIKRGDVQTIEKQFGATKLSVVAARRAGTRMKELEYVWQAAVAIAELLEIRYSVPQSTNKRQKRNVE